MSKRSAIFCFWGIASGLFALAGCDADQQTASERVTGAMPDLALQSASLDAGERFHWQMNCQGCHHPNGEGNPERNIPRLEKLEEFQRFPEGREFLIRVPGMSRSALSDEDLTRLANWMMVEFSTPGATQDWAPYTIEEVAELRSKPIVDGVTEARAALIEKIRKDSI